MRNFLLISLAGLLPACQAGGSALPQDCAAARLVYLACSRGTLSPEHEGPKVRLLSAVAQ